MVQVNKCKSPKTYLYLDDPLHAYLYGYLWADGHVNKTGGITASSKEPDILNILVETFGGKIKKRIRIQKETGNTKTVYDYVLHRKLFTIDFVKHGFRKTTEKIPAKSREAFILGFLDGDGCIYHKEDVFQLTFTSNLDQDWSWFTDLAGNEIFTISKRSSWCKSLNKRTHSSIARVTTKKALNFLDNVYNSYSGPCLQRKKDKYLGYKSWLEEKKVR